MKQFKTGLYTIEKNIAISQKRKEIIRFPFEKMEVGDSFFIPSSDQAINAARSSLFTAIRTFNIFHNKTYKILTRAQEKGLRVWRIK